MLYNRVVNGVEVTKVINSPLCLFANDCLLYIIELLMV